MPGFRFDLRSKFHMISEGRWWWGFLLVLCGFFTWMAFWALVEPDVLWQSRAGAEILRNRQIQTQDTWSFTAYGKPWTNLYWLSCLLFYWTSKLLPNYEGFTYLRCFFVFVIMMGVGTTLSLATHKNHPYHQKGRHFPAWAPLIVLMPLVFEMIGHRLQMRSELITIALFVWLVANSLTKSPLINRQLNGLLILLVWANIHAGTLAFGFFYFCGVMFFDAAPLAFYKRCIGATLALSTYAFNPLGFDILRYIFVNVSVYDPNLIGNLDYQSLNMRLLKQWSMKLWAAYVVLTWLAFFILYFKKKERLPGVYKNVFFVCLVGGVLTALSLSRIRANPYHILFFVPVAAVAIQEILFWALVQNRKTKVTPALIVAGVAVFMWGYIMPKNYQLNLKLRSAGVPDWQTPIQAVQFLKKYKPAKNLLNAYNFGSYIVAELPELPVSIDSREILFLDFTKTLVAALKAGPDAYQEFLKQFNINTVIDSFHSTYGDWPGYGKVDRHRIYYPIKDWAIVFLDSISMVLLKRIPENLELIRQFEYHYIRPGMPCNFAATTPFLGEEERNGWLNEAHRCLRIVPRNTYCLFVEYFFAERRGDHQAALGFLDSIEKINPNTPAVYAQKVQVYSQLGNQELTRIYQYKYESFQ